MKVVLIGIILAAITALGIAVLRSRVEERKLIQKQKEEEIIVASEYAQV